MARNISHTLILEGDLVAGTPLHTGGADTGHTSDMPLAVDGKGRFYLPGTSIAGAIRAWQQTAEDDEVWGYAGKDEKKDHASFVIVDDAPADDAPLAELWHGIGIDRRYGGAAENIKFDRQVLPQGTRFRFRLQREVAAGDALDEARQSMGNLLVALETGRIRFGGGGTRGFGRLGLEKATGKQIDWNTRRGILDWLAGDARGDEEAADTWRRCAQNAPSKVLEIAIHWQPLGPLMSKAARDGMAVDMLPFVSRNQQGQEALALPGSSIKGAWRQQAERIVRTVLGTDGMTVPGNAHHEQVDVPLVRELFGAARPPDPRNKDDARTRAARGLLAVDTCYAGLALDSREWDGLDTDAESWRDSAHPLYKADHVAIDRWTGGAADGALFNAVEPDRSVTWEPIRLWLDCRRGEPLPSLALLWLVLRDFCTGRVPLGFGVNRGYGDLEVKKIELRGLAALGVAGLGAEAVELEVTERKIDEKSISPLVSAMKDAWTGWLNPKSVSPKARQEEKKP